MSQSSRNVFLAGGCGAGGALGSATAATLPSGPGAGCAPITVGSAKPPGGGSRAPLRPHPASPSASANATARAHRVHRLTNGRGTIRAPHTGGTIAECRLQATFSWPRSGHGAAAALAHFFQSFEPFAGFAPHVCRRRAAKTGAALDRPFGRKDRPHVFGNSRFDFLHRGERKAAQRQSIFVGRRDDPPGDVVSLAERQPK